MSGKSLESEWSATGEQTLLPGVGPISLRQRLEFKACAPLAPKSRQKPLNIGLSDEDARNQLNLF